MEGKTRKQEEGGWGGRKAEGQGALMEAGDGEQHPTGSLHPLQSQLEART